MPKAAIEPERLATADYARMLETELQRTRNALGDLLARIELAECPLCGAIPARVHGDGCPVPKALQVWDA